VSASLGVAFASWGVRVRVRAKVRVRAGSEAAAAAAAAQDVSHTLSPRSEPAVAQPDADALRALQRETVEAAAVGEAGDVLDGALERGAAVVCNEIHRLQWQLFERVHALRARTRLVRAESVRLGVPWGGGE
jgi:hypothetical protein